MYAMMRRDGREPCRTFWEAFQSSPQRRAAGWEWAWDYQTCFNYSQKVRGFLEWFPTTQLFIRPYECLKQTPERFYLELTEFLGVSALDVNQANRHVNTSPSQLDMIYQWKLGRLAMKAAKAVSFSLPQSFRACIQSKFEQPAFRLIGDDRDRLIDYFGADIYDLSLLLQWDVTEWLKP